MKTTIAHNLCVAVNAFQAFFKSFHHKVILCGLLIGLIYLIPWLSTLATFIVAGATFPFATIGANYVGLNLLWQERQEISNLTASPTARKLGHFAIWFGVALFPFCRDKVWSQALIWSLILIAIALSSWNLGFFRRYWCPALLVLFSTYPSSFLSFPQWMWNAVMPPASLEQFTAWASGHLLLLAGYSVVIDNIHVLLPTGGISVYGACTGFEMMTSMISVSIISGVAFQMCWKKVLVLIFLGTTLALSLNLVRVALMTIAVAEWGEQAFEFLHGFWGGQIFAGILFTIYYYLVVWLLSSGHSRISLSSTSTQAKAP